MAIRLSLEFELEIQPFPLLQLETTKTNSYDSASSGFGAKTQRVIILATNHVCINSYTTITNVRAGGALRIPRHTMVTTKWDEHLMKAVLLVYSERCMARLYR